ncbi:MAG: tRNA (adenosine(37)-N6)-threonylcarbamoyltransferase complex dimerization subunit type 1 TsaB [Planctomycetota bacterium]|jgi:tRNA threonylcarbamoyladenosine biosynthesis protein TsaB
MAKDVSIAIETSSRTGGLALGMGDELVREVCFDASARHAAKLITRLSKLLDEADIRPADLDSAYVSVGPGSFTGLRIGVTVVRTLSQMLSSLRCVAVPTAAAVAQNAGSLKWEHLGVVMVAREESFYAAMFRRSGEQIIPVGEGALVAAEDFLARSPRPLTLIGEAVQYCDFAGEGIEIVDESLHPPRPEGLWRVGRAMAKAGEFTEPDRLLPIYARKPAAERLWVQRGQTGGSDG